MKTTTIKRGLGGLALAGALIALPSLAFALDTKIEIGGDGVIRVQNAQVSSVSGPVINAFTNFKNTVLNFVITTNASTSISGADGETSAFTNIQVGDKLNLTGVLSSIGTNINLMAAKVVDLNSEVSVREKSGLVQSVNTTNGSFIIKSNDKLVTVKTNASTTFAWNQNATTAISLSSLIINSKVNVKGIVNADGTVITATRVTAHHNDIKKALKKDWKVQFKNLFQISKEDNQNKN